MAVQFTHLHVHTGYSLLDGSAKINEIVARTKELGMDSLAITDHGVMYGVIDFYRACKKEGIRPILGCEVYVAPGSRFSKEGGAADDRYYHLVLLAENNKGYANLIKIVSKGFTEGYYYKPRVDDEVLRQYHEGIIALSACLAGEVAVLLKRGFYEEGKKAALRMQDIFGKGNYFLELQDHGIPEQRTVNQALLRLHEETGIDLVATNDVHYILDTDAMAHDILLCIQTQSKVSDENRMRYEGGQFFLKSPEQMEEVFPYAREALENTHKIAERCQVEIEFGHYKLPKFDVPEGYDAWSYIQKLCADGMKKRYGTVTPKLQERLDYELNIVHTMGFVDYYLIVWDFIKFAKDHGIMVGPGRGSGAASIAAYALGITDIDPIRYQLLFERFLNPERVSMPDFDIDFCYERRQEVIDYVVQKYGKDHVVQIVTFGTMAARNVIRDVGRALDYPYAQVDMVAKLVPNELGITIEKALQSSQEFRKLYQGDDQVKHLIDMAKRLEGLPRHTSMHAAGVVISNAPADDYVPLSRGADDAITTQYTMTTLEELGLLKMDFLGLRTLTVIQNAVKLVNRNRGEQDKLDMSQLDYEDPQVYEMIGTGRTDGVFQLESTGMKNFMKELKPGSLEDVIAGISLYRPGPMDFIPKYIRGKQEPESIVYDCPELEPILETTYGCIVYQEQVMQIVRDLAGYSYGRSDLVRRAMAKKKADVMARERKNFVYGNPEEGVKGCIANGISEEIGNKIYDEMTDFAKYAFNKAHAACYAVVSYQTAYLKLYHPVEFMAALMTSVMDNPGKVSEYIYACRQMGIQLLPPDINEGEAGFSVSGQGIRYGLSAIKGVGRPVIDALVRERERNGKFTGLKDFADRMAGNEVNKRTVESFIKAGALDGLRATRKQLMLVYAGVMDGVTQERKRGMTGQISLFDFADEETKQEYEIRLPEVGEYAKEELLAMEKEVLGVYVSGHPLESFLPLLKSCTTADSLVFQLDEEIGETKVQDGETVTIGGLITGITRKTTKNGATMAFLTLEDLFSAVEVIVFPRDYERYRAFLTEDAKVLVRGRASVEEERAAKLICSEITPLTELPRELWLKFRSKQEYLSEEAELFALLEESDGSHEVCIYLQEERAVKRLPRNRCVMITEELLQKLRNRYGEEQVKVVEKKR